LPHIRDAANVLNAEFDEMTPNQVVRAAF